MARGDNTVRALPWDGTNSGRCDHIGCDSSPVVHFELSTSGEWVAEADLCGEHLPEIADQARAFAVAVGAIDPTTQLDRNLRATTSEHMP